MFCLDIRQEVFTKKDYKKENQSSTNNIAQYVAKTSH